MEKKITLALNMVSCLITVIIGAICLIYYLYFYDFYADPYFSLCLFCFIAYATLSFYLIKLKNWARVGLMGITFVLIVINILLALLYSQVCDVMGESCASMPEVVRFNICFVVVFTAYFFFLNNSKVKEQFK